MEHWNSITPIYQQQENFDTKLTSPVLQRNSVVTTSSVVSNPYSNLDETMNSLKSSMNKMMTSLERMEQRLNRVEQTTNQILKNQQEVLQAPFISQHELDNARKVAEQFEQDSAVAKQLQAAYNKEIEVRKNMAPRHTQQWQTVQTPMMQVAMNQAGQCPICGGRFAMNVLENHVQQCLDQFSEDPKKEIEIQETKKKMETGFFGRLIKSTKTTEKKQKLFLKIHLYLENMKWLLIQITIIHNHIVMDIQCNNNNNNLDIQCNNKINNIPINGPTMMDIQIID